MRIRCILSVLAILLLSTNAFAAVSTGGDDDQTSDPSDGPEWCTLNGGGISCEFFTAEVADPHGEATFRYGFLAYTAGVPVSSSGESMVCFYNEQGQEQCVCTVSVTGEIFAQPLYSGLALSNVITIPNSFLPPAPDGRLDFEVKAQLSEPGLGCNAGFFSDSNAVNCRLSLDTVYGQYPGHQDEPSFASPLLAVVEEREGVIQLTFPESYLAEGIYVYRRTPGRPWKQVANVDAKTREYFDDVAYDTYYEYKVVAYNAYGASIPSDIASVTTSPEITLASPTLNEPELFDDGRVLLSWSTKSGRSIEFSLQRKVGLLSEFVEIARLTNSTNYFTDFRESVPEINTMYVYQVVAVTSSETAHSNEISIVFGQPHSRTLSPLPGHCETLDVNSDGVVNTTDSLIIVSDLRTNGTHTATDATSHYDVNDDGVISLADALIVVSALRSGDCQYPEFGILDAVIPQSEEPIVPPVLPTPVNIQVSPALAGSSGGYLAAVRFSLQPSTLNINGSQPLLEYQVEALGMSPDMGHRGWQSLYWSQGSASSPNAMLAPGLPNSLVDRTWEDLNKMSFMIRVSQKWTTPTGVKWVSAYTAYSYQSKLLGLLSTNGELENSTCGDGLLDTSSGEQCDHGSANGIGLGSYCLANCRIVEASCYFEQSRQDCLGYDYYFDWHNPFISSALQSEGEGDGEPALPREPQLLDEAEMKIESISSTLQYANIDGDEQNRLDSCVRKADGIWCSINTELGYAAPSKWTSDFSDSHAWLDGLAIDVSNYRTLKLVDMNADGKADVCARGVRGLWCALSTGAGFEAARIWNSYFSDTYGFRDESKYLSIRFANTNGDSAGFTDVCGRLLTHGMFCGTGDGTHVRNSGWWLRSYSHSYADINSLDTETLSMADINNDGKSDICGLYQDAIYCSLSSGYSFARLSKWYQGDQTLVELLVNNELPFTDSNNDGRQDICYLDSQSPTCLISTGTSFSKQTE